MLGKEISKTSHHTDDCWEERKGKSPPEKDNVEQITFLGRSPPQYFQTWPPHSFP